MLLCNVQKWHVFCYQISIRLDVRKNYSKNLKFEAEGREFAKICIEITRTIRLNSEKSEHFLVMNPAQTPNCPQTDPQQTPMDPNMI